MILADVSKTSMGPETARTFAENSREFKREFTYFEGKMLDGIVGEDEPAQCVRQRCA